VGEHYLRPTDLRAAGLYVYFETFEGREGCAPGEIRMSGRKVLMFGSNDYLDLTNHPKVKEAAQAAIQKYGTGCSGSRLLNGTLDLHVRLEAELAALTGKEDAMTFGTGFQTNYAGLSGLADKGDILLCDHNIHASLVEGALRTPARVLRYHHNDMAHLEHYLQECDGQAVLIVTESVFSMEGDVADLVGTARLARQYGARLYVDEAHSLGVFGTNGAGLAQALGVLGDVDVFMGTFSKSLASIGGFVASTRPVIDYLKHTARPFVFSASVAPGSIAAVLATLEIMRQEPERQQRLFSVARRLKDELTSRGFWVLHGDTPIVPVVIPDAMALLRMCRALLDEGVYVNAVLRPAATHNLLRISCTAAHTEEHVGIFVDALERVAKRLGVKCQKHRKDPSGSNGHARKNGSSRAHAK
jgi:8-amino-7-oxononanoate synthase